MNKKHRTIYTLDETKLMLIKNFFGESPDFYKDYVRNYEENHAKMNEHTNVRLLEPGKDIFELPDKTVVGVIDNTKFVMNYKAADFLNIDFRE